MSDLATKIKIGVEGAKTAAQDIEALTQKFADFSNRIGAMGHLAVFGVGLNQIALSAKNLIDQADGINDMTQRIGVSIQALASWQLAANQSGTSLEAVAKGVKGLSAYMLDHGEILGKVGITASDADGAITQLADLFAAMPDGIQKTTLATQLFGKAGIEMIPMLNQGSAGLQTAKEKAEAYAKALKELAPKADEFNDQISEIKLNFEAAAMNGVTPFMAGLTGLAAALNDVAKGGDAAKRALAFLRGAEGAGGLPLRAVAAGVDIANGSAVMPGAGGLLSLGARWLTSSLNAKDQGGGSRESSGAITYPDGTVTVNPEDGRRAAWRAAEPLRRANELLRAAEREKEAKERAAKAARDLARANEEARRAEASWRAEVEKSQEAIAKETYELLKKAEQTQLESDTYGMTKSQIEGVTIARLQEQLALVDGYDSQEGLVKNLENEISARKQLQQAMANVEARADAKRAAEDIQRQQVDMWRSIESTAHDVWTSVWQDGSNAFKNIGKVIKSAILDLLYQITIKRWIIGVSASVSGSAVAGELGGSGGVLGTVGGLANTASSLGNLLNMASRAYKFVTGGFAETWNAIANSSVGVSMGLGTGPLVQGAEGVQSTLFQTMNQGTTTQLGTSIGEGLASAGAGIIGTAIGTAIAGDKQLGGISGGTMSAIGSASGWAIGASYGSSFGPWGALIGGIVGGVVNAAFGTGPKKIKATGVEGDFSGMGFSGVGYQDWKKKGGWFSKGKKGTDYFALPPETIAQMSQDFMLLKLSVGSLADSLNAPTAAIVSYSRHIRQSLEGGAYAALMESMRNDMAALALAGTDFAKEGESSFTTLSRLADSLGSANTMFDRLGQTLLDVSLAGGDAASQLFDLSGGKDKFTASLDAYFQSIYSDTERNDILGNTLAKSFAQLGYRTPGSRDEFRQLVEAQDKMSADGRATYLALLGMAPSFAQNLDFTAAQNSRDLGSEGFANVVDFNRAKRLRVTQATPVTAPELEAKLEALRAAFVAGQQDTVAGQVALARLIADSTRILREWNGNGMPETRVVVA